MVANFGVCLALGVQSISIGTDRKSARDISWCLKSRSRHETVFAEGTLNTTRACVRINHAYARFFRISPSRFEAKKIVFSRKTGRACHTFDCRLIIRRSCSKVHLSGSETTKNPPVRVRRSALVSRRYPGPRHRLPAFYRNKICAPSPGRGTVERGVASDQGRPRGRSLLWRRRADSRTAEGVGRRGPHSPFHSH